MEPERRPASLLRGATILLPPVALLIAIAPLTMVGFPAGHDWLYELTRVAEYAHAIEAGQVPPFWGENLYGGYGSPVFLFYAPLYASVATAFAAALGSVAAGAAAAIAFFTIVGLLATIVLMRAVVASSPGPAVHAGTAVRVGAIAFLLNPYLIGNALLRNANAEYAALCLLPIPLAGLLHLGRNRRLGVAMVGGGLALCILAHNLTGLTCAALLVMWAVILYVPGGGRSLWIGFGAGVGLGLLVSAFFWIPALALKDLVRTEELLVGKFDFRTQFQPIASHFGYERFFAAGILPLALVLAAVGWILGLRMARRPIHGGRVAIALLVTVLGSLFLQTVLSRALWEVIPFLPMFQFPWRFMGPLALASALLGGLLVLNLEISVARRWVLGAELLFLALCTVNALPHLRKARPIPADVRPHLHAVLSPAGIRKTGVSVTVRDEYLPRGADPSVWKNKPACDHPVVGADRPLDLRIIRDQGTAICLETRSRSANRLRIGRWFFPGWEITVNGQARVPQANAVGSMDVRIPPGAGTVRLAMRAPGIRRICLWVSALGLGLLVLLVVLAIRGRIPKLQ